MYFLCCRIFYTYSLYMNQYKNYLQNFMIFNLDQAPESTSHFKISVFDLLTIYLLKPRIWNQFIK